MHLKGTVVGVSSDWNLSFSILFNFCFSVPIIYVLISYCRAVIPLIVSYIMDQVASYVVLSFTY